MTWDHDSLWAKCKIYIERAFTSDREGPLFPFWASLGMEFLARSTLALRHPALLADIKGEPNLMFAFGWKDAQKPNEHPISTGAKTVFDRCSKLHPRFDRDDVTFCNMLAGRRNEELHTGALPFEGFKTSQWLADFYCACDKLLTAQGRTLLHLFGEEESHAARVMIAARERSIADRTAKLIGQQRKAFEALDSAEQQRLRVNAKFDTMKRRQTEGHKVECPACGSDAITKGVIVSTAQPVIEGEMIVVRNAIIPQEMRCLACGLFLSNHGELHAAGLGGQHTRRARWDPAEYYATADDGGEDYFNE